MNKFEQARNTELIKLIDGRYHYHVTSGKILKRKDGLEAGSLNQNGYRNIKIHGKPFKSHLISWVLNYKAFPSKHIDHIDGNTQNNIIDNLREVSHRENCMNRNYHREGKLVGTRKDKNVWTARIRVKNKRFNLGRYSSEEEAHLAYLFAVEEFDV